MKFSEVVDEWEKKSFIDGVWYENKDLMTWKEKAEKYDAFSTVGIVKDKIKLREENKQLIQQIHDLEEAMDYEPDLIERLELTKENKELKEEAYDDETVINGLARQKDELKEEKDNAIDTLKIRNEEKRKLLEIAEKIKKFCDEQTTLELNGEYDSLEEANEAGTNDAWWLLILKELLATKEGKSQT